VSSSASTTRGSAPPAQARSDVVLSRSSTRRSACSPSSWSAASACSRRSRPRCGCSGSTVSLGACSSWGGVAGRSPSPLAAAVHMFVVGVTMPEVMGQFTLQVVYFIAFSAVAWARDRRLMLAVVGSIVLVMFVWIAWQFLLGSGVQEIVDDTRGARKHRALPAGDCRGGCSRPHQRASTSAGAIIGGQLVLAERRDSVPSSRRAGRDHHPERDPATRGPSPTSACASPVSSTTSSGTTSRSSASRPAAARRVLTRDPDAAADGPRAIETSSRAVSRRCAACSGPCATPSPRPPTSRRPDAGAGIADLPTWSRAANGRARADGLRRRRVQPGRCGRRLLVDRVDALPGRAGGPRQRPAALHGPPATGRCG
jgi:hypothetical protein